MARHLAGLVMLAVVVPAFGQTAARLSKQYTIEQFIASTSVRDASFSADEKRLLFSSNQTGIFNVYSVPVAGGEPTPMTSSTSDTTYAVSYFPTDDRILFTRDQGGNELNHLYVRETDGTERDLTPGSKLKAIFEGWTPAGEAFYVLSNERDPRYFDVYRYDAKSYERKLFHKNETGYQFGAISDDGTVNDDGRTAIRIVETKTGRPLTLPRLPVGDITSVTIAPSEGRLAFYVNCDRSPNNLYVWAIGESAPRRLTDTLSKEIDAADLVDSDVIRFKSFDGTTVPSIFFKPHQATPQSKAPALVWVHGGPGGQTRKGYSALIQYLVNHGYVVLGINNRGSSGYGKTFYTADDQKHGREPLWDCVEGKKYLATLPYVDKDRIAIIGGSYGGYMVLAALSLQPDAFAVGVDLFGISNWVRTLESIPAWWESQRLALYKEIGDPVKQKAMLTEVSPLFHSTKIKKPLMVLQGANDPRVIKPESDDIVAAVKKNGVPVEYVVFADEGHGFTKKKNQIEGYRKILEFLDRHLKGAPAVAQTPQ